MSNAADGLAAQVGVHRTVLIVDDDAETLSGLSRMLRHYGLTIYEASTGIGAVQSALTHRPDVLLLDNRLGKPGDVTGIDVIDACHAQSFYPTWILYSGFMDLDLAVDSGRRNPFCVITLPSTDIETAVIKALTAVREGKGGGWPILPVGQLHASQTNAGRGAGWMLVACDSPDDLPSFPAWASFVNTNERRMRDLYEQLGREPHHVKSFMRWFRALARAEGHVENAIAEMAVGDSRTLKRLRDDAGLRRPSGVRIPLEQFLRSQSFLPIDHVLVKTLRSLTALRNLPDSLKR